MPLAREVRAGRRPQAAGRREHGQRQQVGGDHEQRTGVARELRQIAKLRHDAVRIRVLYEHAAHVVWREEEEMREKK